MPDDDLIERLDALLPQTQCRQCGHAGCRPYAAATATGAAGTDQCPPGGEAVARALAAALGRPYRPPDPRFGTAKPPAVARIDEAACIGCALCIRACPVDAIAGAPKFMHTVIATECTGCELCLPPCPVDCIDMVGVAAATGAQRTAQAQRAKQRFRARERRLARERESAARAAAQRAAAARRRRTVARAIDRARTRLARKTASG
jgi:electron transport complex protein RnfB